MRRNGGAAKAAPELRELLGEIYDGQGAPIEAMPDDELIEIAGALTRGVPMASPVFDGAREDDIVGMLTRRGWPRRVR